MDNINNNNNENNEQQEFKSKDDYTGGDIQVLEGLEPVRKRPGMYIGSTGPEGLHHMIWEIVDNSIDEVMAGHATRVIVTLTKEGSIIVDDNGRGIPVDIHQKTGISTVETVLTVLHAGGKFDNNAYKISGGLHGVGASVTNALSKWFKVWVDKDGKQYYAKFGDGGKILEKLHVIGNASEKEHGTTIEFYPDFTIMEQHPFDRETIITRLQRMAYLNKGLKITFVDQQTGQVDNWQYDKGIIQFVEDLNKDKESLIKDIVYGDVTKKVKTAGGEEYNLRCEVAFQYNKSYNVSLFSFCNNIITPDGGTHERGFRDALVRLINKFALDKKFLKDNDDKITKDDVLEGLAVIISVKHPQPQYKGQTKGELGNTEVSGFVNDVTSKILEKFILENPEEAATIIKKVLFAKEARLKAQEAREATRRKSPFDSGSLPGKLTDCELKDNTVTELYIVEGDSAGGSAKQGREHAYQAILPLKGKILNVEKAKTNKIFENDEIMALITAIGCGVLPEFTLEKIRYNKIIIMTDADVDGAHIRILLLTFFYRYMKPIIEMGCVYAAQPPLYKFISGKLTQYVYTDQQLEEIKKQAGNTKFTIQRYKGLGEMDASQLWETTMDPERRILHKITIDDAIKADQMFSFLMGDDVQPRKDFISANAKFVKNLDV